MPLRRKRSTFQKRYHVDLIFGDGLMSAFDISAVGGSNAASQLERPAIRSSIVLCLAFPQLSSFVISDFGIQSAALSYP